MAADNSGRNLDGSLIGSKGPPITSRPPINVPPSGGGPPIYTGPQPPPDSGNPYGTELCPDGTVIPVGEICPAGPPVVIGPPGVPNKPFPNPNPPVQPPGGPAPPPPPGGPVNPGDPGPGGGGCPCPGDPGGGGPTGGGPSGPNCPPPPTVCMKHDGTVVDSNGNAVATQGNGDVWYNQDVPGCEGVIAASSIPYCDDLPKDCPEHPAVEDGTKCCKEAFQAIADAMKEIAKALDKKFELTQEMIDKWLDYIAGKIKDKILPPAKTCEQCCKRIEIGLATEAECKMVAANCTCQSCVDSCESFNEGECCKNCGSTNCKCKEGKCIGDDKTPDKKWTAWCDHTTGTHLSTDDGNPPAIAGDWTKSGTFDTFEASDSITCSVTEPGGGTPPRDGTYTPLPVSWPTRSVDICGASNLTSTSAAGAYLASHASNALAVGIAAANASQNVMVNLANTIDLIPVVGDILKGVIAETQAPIAQSLVLAPAFKSLTGCDTEGVASGLTTLAIAGTIGQRMGVNVESFVLDTTYALNAACRKRLPTPAQALNAVLAKALPDSHLDRYYAAAGYCAGVSDVDLQAARSKPLIAELLGMNRRGIITDQEYVDGIRELGYLESDMPSRYKKLLDVYPGPQDVVRFMQRDTDDPGIVDKFKLDDQFDDKYNTKLKEWAKFQGVPDEVMKYYWRAHWDIPSATALTSMYQRLRYDDVPADQKVSIDDVRSALIQQDILPFWVEKYIALMHPPLGRIDIRRSYQNGTLSDDETKRALGELGYSDDNIDKLFKFMQKLKEQGASNHRMIKRWVALLVDRPEVQSEMQNDGYTEDQIDKALETASPRLVSSVWAKAYVTGEISEIDFRNLLTGHGVTGDSVDQITQLLTYKIKDTATIKAYVAGILTRQSALDRMTTRGMLQSAAQHELDIADDTFNAAHAAKCSANIKTRYIRGAMDADEAKSKLIVNGIASEWADRLIGKWKCELNSKDKAVTADKLCGWVARGSIDVAELKQRLIRLGYTEPDALNLVGDCADRIATKQAKEQAKQQAEADKDKQKVEANARRNESRANAEIRKLEVARKAKNMLRQTRQTQELSTLKNLVTKCECTDSTAVSMFQSNKDRITSQFGFTTDEANRVLLKASEIWLDGKPESFPPVVDELARVLSTSEAEALTPEP